MTSQSPAAQARLPGLLLALTFSTGIVDAVSFLGLDRVFTGNVTGNVLLLGMAAAGSPGLSPLRPAVSLVAFAAGATLAGRVLRVAPAVWTHRTTVLFALVGAMLLLCSGVWLGWGERQGVLSAVVTAALGLAMGAQAATARRLAVADLNTVVVTVAFTGLAAESPLGERTHRRWRRRAGSVALLGAGAVTGALLLRIHPGLGLLLSATVVLAVAAAGTTLVPPAPEGPAPHRQNPP